MRKITKPVLTVLAGFAVLFGISAPADAAPAGGKRPAVRSVCETGHRGMPEYDRKCLVTGTFASGVMLWFADSDGHRYTTRERRAACRDARSTGSVRRGVTDALNDVAYDRYRNHRYVLRVAGLVAVMDCRALGIK